MKKGIAALLVSSVIALSSCNYVRDYNSKKEIKEQVKSELSTLIKHEEIGGYDIKIKIKDKNFAEIEIKFCDANHKFMDSYIKQRAYLVKRDFLKSQFDKTGKYYIDGQEIPAGYLQSNSKWIKYKGELIQ
jgi:hypothetical protein